ncbi:unnamed protein product, partial [Prorocentrum cordatum]
MSTKPSTSPFDPQLWLEASCLKFGGKPIPRPTAYIPFLCHATLFAVVPTMSACRVASFVSGPVARCALLGLLVSALLTAACLSASGGDAGQKVAAALEETWLVVALLIVHLVVSRLRGDAPPKPRKKKAGAALEERGCEAAFAPAPGGAACGDSSGDDALRAQAIGKLTTRVRSQVKAGDMAGAEESMREMREVG